MTSVKSTTALRMRVFAGPNGSGKSTIIQAVRDYKIKSIPLDFGIYINADDIVQLLLKNKFNFTDYSITTTNDEFKHIVLHSGLINIDFTEQKFISGYVLKNNKIKLTDTSIVEQFAQLLADFLRKKLLAEKKKFSFETVFSHPSKLDIMQEAKDAGYKVYLYFVSTESPEINKGRVILREKKGGHNVPPDKIESRYYRSLDLLYKASQLSYQTFFFDNSETGKDFKLFARFKIVDGKKHWSNIKQDDFPEWFKKYYLNKNRKQ